VRCLERAHRPVPSPHQRGDSLLVCRLVEKEVLGWNFVGEVQQSFEVENGRAKECDFATQWWAGPAKLKSMVARQRRNI
jgi:hypothetical protein